jgi:hypothetical protein
MMPHDKGIVKCKVLKSKLKPWSDDLEPEAFVVVAHACIWTAQPA